ncbi:homoserine dehydrogenase [Shouchella lehensis]|uniref:Homoserine dehydrogenase n=2 Tax=Shouchella lehensis TaxID=300825 RepID=A0A060LRU4_9BACI|nr:homoserine dehydrogenase [Shouchella lehensis]AIC93976.1 homoserine dehydrogenase [Shouchella lehensis G1]TES48013.1 homoserine dehydrogenase [Shouchella lehensis]
MKIGLIGYGTVGSGVYERLIGSREQIESIIGEKFEIVRILVKNVEKYKDVNSSLFTSSWDTFFNTDKYDIVFEAINGTELTRTYTKALLKQGTSVISANKKLVALHGEELEQLAFENQAYYGWDAAVCGAIPIVNVFKSVLLTTNVQSIAGILNGTSNYILTKMSEGSTYEAALEEAQKLGYAEEDPTSDVEGWDAVYKLCLLARQCYDQWVCPDDIDRVGISHIDQWHIQAAKELNLSFKLIAKLESDATSLKGFVKPALIDQEHSLAPIRGVLNAVTLEGKDMERLIFAGPGAGKETTANSVVEDFVFHEQQKHVIPRFTNRLTKLEEGIADNVTTQEVWFCKENHESKIQPYLDKTTVWREHEVKGGKVFVVTPLPFATPFHTFPLLTEMEQLKETVQNES